MKLMFSNVHHVAIIGTDYQRTKEFYVDKLGFKVISENIRIEKNDIILNANKYPVRNGANIKQAPDYKSAIKLIKKLIN